METSQVASLKITAPNGTDRMVVLGDGRSYRAGRSETVDIRLEDPSVSRVHAMFTASATGVVVSDLSSTNGVFVNGKKIEGQKDLSTGDVVDLGPFKIGLFLDSTQSTSRAMSGRTMTAQLKPSTAVALLFKIKNFAHFFSEFPDNEKEINHAQAFWGKQVAGVIEELGGKVDKVLHGSVIGLWYSSNVSEVTNAALQAAFRVIESTRALNVTAHWPFRDQEPFECQAFLHSGMALVGTVGGTSGQRDFAVLGDTINVLFTCAEVCESQSCACVVSDSILPHVPARFFKNELKMPASNGAGELHRMFELRALAE